MLQGIDGLYTDTHIFPSPGGSPGRSPGASPGASPGGSPGGVRFNSTNGRDALTLTVESQGEEEKDEESGSSGVLVVSHAGARRLKPFWHLRLGKNAKKLLSGAVAGGISRTGIARYPTFLFFVFL